MKKLLFIAAVVFLVVSPFNSFAFDMSWIGKSKTVKQDKAEAIYREALGAYGTASYPKAVELAGQAIKEDETFAKAYVLRGKANKDMGDVASALEDLNRAIELDPKSGEAYYVRGFSYEIMGETEKAKADYTKGCEAGFKDACQ